MNISEIKELAQIMQEANLSSVEIDGDKVTLKREITVQNVVTTQISEVAQQPVVSAPTQKPVLVKEGKVITAPTVGVFYSAASPDSAPYVKVGDTVKSGDVLCIIEAMKLMNEIQSDCEGEIAEIMAANGDVVEYGQPLFRVV